MLSIITNPVELSQEQVLKIFKYKKPEFYGRLFDDSEEGPFEVPTYQTKKDEVRQPVPGATKFFFQ